MTDRLRFAPSPTGYLHVGGARTALFNWLYAKHYGGQFLLRIEDTDKARSTDESTRAIFEGLEWLGLTWDEAVVYQGANLARHQRDARALLERGRAYRCFCTPEELDLRRRDAEQKGGAFHYDRRCDRLPADEVQRRVAAGMPFTIRFRVPDDVTETTWKDVVHGDITFPNKDIDDFVVLRSDGTPIYNLAVVSDDIDMRISIVMRGDDHISNTPKQIMLYQALGATLPKFAHLPMIHGATAVADYQHMGIVPEAMLNFLALLGWSPGHDIEVMSLDEMVRLFDVEGLSKKAAVFDPQKLDWMNGQHLSRATSERLLPVVATALEAAGLATQDDVAKRRDWYLSLINLLKIRSRTIDDIVRQSVPFVRDTIEYDEDAVAKQWKEPAFTIEILEAATSKLRGLNEWTHDALEQTLRGLAESRGVSAGKVFQPLRVGLTGLAVSPGIFEVLTALGRDRSLKRLDAALAYIKKRKGQ